MKKDKTELWFNEVKNKTNSEYEALDEYKNCKHANLVRHNECGNEYLVTPDRFRAGNRCPKCASKRNGKRQRLKPEEFLERAMIILGDDYEILTEFTTTHNKVKVHHESCGHIYDVLPRHILYDENKCPSCPSNGVSSRAEFLINEILLENNISFSREYSFGDLIYIKRLYFDFKIDLNNGKFILLEYDGEFHFKPYSQNDYHIKNYEDQVIRDNLKNEYCKNKNIDLIRIPYWKEKDLKTIINRIINNNDVQRLSKGETSVERTNVNITK